MSRIGVVLSGCGFMDGAEIHEATLTLLYLDTLGEEIVCMAPDASVIDTVDHARRKPGGEKRNVLAESARIARGAIRDIAGVKAEELDALVFPGGFGAAKNLCDWATKGPDCTVNKDVERLIKELYKQKKPLGFICIAPVLAAKVLGSQGISLTIGNDAATARGIEQTGAKHKNCAVDETCVDSTHRLVSTPAYMLGPSIAPVSKGIQKLVNQISAWTK
ncbi:MAG: isoprenoid biosynthesis protein ElbB [Myxococcales bacterium]|nr:MAG: isoprenoid biosynthesis protein ElbB [Myxococcales bacterium]